jgi:nucleoside-diphosphate-sugar epimerase
LPLKEDDITEPWTYVAKHKSQVENDLKNVPGLRYSVVRPAIVYGPGDRTGLGIKKINNTALSFLVCNLV